MGKVRAVANGNILDEADVHPSLIESGIYERIEGDGSPATVSEPAPEPAEPEDGDTSVAPLTTADMPKGKKSKK